MLSLFFLAIVFLEGGSIFAEEYSQSLTLISSDEKLALGEARSWEFPPARGDRTYVKIKARIDYLQTSIYIDDIRLIEDQDKFLLIDDFEGEKLSPDWKHNRYQDRIALTDSWSSQGEKSLVWTFFAEGKDPNRWEEFRKIGLNLDPSAYERLTFSMRTEAKFKNYLRVALGDGVREITLFLAPPFTSLDITKEYGDIQISIPLDSFRYIETLKSIEYISIYAREEDWKDFDTLLSEVSAEIDSSEGLRSCSALQLSLNKQLIKSGLVSKAHITNSKEGIWPLVYEARSSPAEDLYTLIFDITEMVSRDKSNLLTLSNQGGRNKIDGIRMPMEIERLEIVDCSFSSEEIRKVLKLSSERLFNTQKIEIETTPSPFGKPGGFGEVKIRITKGQVETLKIEELQISLKMVSFDLVQLCVEQRIKLKAVLGVHMNFTISESGFAEFLSEELEEVEELKTEFIDDKIVVSGFWEGMGITSRLFLSGNFEVTEGCKINIANYSLKAGKVYLPNVVTKPLANQVNPILDLNSLKLPFPFRLKVAKVVGKFLIFSTEL